MSGIFSDSDCWERDRQKRFKDTQSVLPALLDLESKKPSYEVPQGSDLGSILSSRRIPNGRDNQNS